MDTADTVVNSDVDFSSLVECDQDESNDSKILAGAEPVSNSSI